MLGQIIVCRTIICAIAVHAKRSVVARNGRGKCVTSSATKFNLACRKKCDCKKEKKKVCDIISNKSYSGECAAACAGAALTVPGVCAPAAPNSNPRACVCTEQYAPVGALGLVYERG